MTTQTITFILLAILIVWIVAIYNGLIRARNRTQEGWSDIDVQLKRRHDLIPNLIESVKGYMQHERSLLEKITELRTQALQAQASDHSAHLADTERALTGALSQLRVSLEAYPDLKANQNVSELMGELTDTENKIEAARRFYNGMVRDFNTSLESFPTNIFGTMLHFAKFDFFQLEDASERANIKVQF